MESKKKIFAIFPSGAGHLNPILCVLGELQKRQKCEVLFYGDEAFRALIEKSGSTFRAYSHPSYSRINPTMSIDKQRVGFGHFVRTHILIAFDILPQILCDIENDTPDMIIYDSFFLMSKYLMEIIKTRVENGTWNRKVPKSVMFLPNYPPCQKMIEGLKKEKPDDWWNTFLLLDSFRLQFMLSWTHGLSLYNPINVCFMKNQVLNIVSVPAELEPFREEFDDTFKFVGACVSDEARSNEIYDDDELKSVLDQFEVKEPPGKQSRSDLKLIYVSMGTVFLANTFIFERVFEAFRDYDSRPSRRFKLAQFRVIVSVGANALKLFKEKINKGELNLPQNVLIRAKVPQLELLKRADLFVTHCGMNSTTETIKYAVPIVAIPIDADQPYNARHVCTDLGFGELHDALKLKSHEIADSIDKVLSDEKYRKNIQEMSKKIQKCNGTLEGARLILDYLNRKD